MAEKDTKKRISFISFIIVLAVLGIILGTSYSKIKANIDKNNINKNDIKKGYVELLKEEDGVYTFVDGNKKVYRYDGYASMTNFYDNIGCVSKVDENSRKQYAIMDKNEKQIVPFGKYDYISQFEEGKFYLVEKDGKHGILNSDGKVVIDTIYDLVSDRKFDIENGECVFACKSSDGKYHYLNEEGKEYISVDSYIPVDFYNVKDNSVAVVNLDGTIYNTKTCEAICSVSQINRLADNVITYDDRFEVYDLDFNLVETVELPNATSILSSSYDGIYTIVGVTLDSGEILNILYNEDGKEIVRSNGAIAIHKMDNKTYFLKEENSNVYVLNEKGNELFVAEGHAIPIRYSEAFYIALAKIGEAQYDFYNKNGKLIQVDSIRSEVIQNGETNSKDYMLVTKDTRRGGYKTYIMQKDLTMIEIENSVDKIENFHNNFLTSDSQQNEVKMYNKDKQVGDIISGTYNEQIGTYSIIKLENGYKIIDLAYLKETFTFNAEELVKIHRNTGVIELTSGFYDLEGNKLV